MTTTMLIDATHAEETRVAIIEGNTLTELDYEIAAKQNIKGNVYLAKVTRVEPSLQAAFVEYGNNKQGFLPFSEIHPDYFRIPIADREALIAQEADFEAEATETEGSEEDGKNFSETVENQPDEILLDAEGNPVIAEEKPAPISLNEEESDFRPRRFNPKRHYKIQEVIKKHQIMLVQVTKEERGNKGAALTTYLSLAGRYCVLMPNSLRAGGISRKISDGKDRKRIKEILEDLEIPQGISIIVRTAGSERNKVEIKRDYEYLSRLWDQIRQDTLEANAPELIYEEGNLIKRALRDMYQSETGDILVEGEAGYKVAKNFMKMLMPTHVKRIVQYKDPIVPLFQRYHVEEQIDSILKPTAVLPSGGYLVINQTEALVSIDVNSGRAIRERNIEETALRTNLEAAEELARQLRLRDLAGLVVIDFIDMEDRRNNHVVEKALRDALRHDRARLQVGRISNFGLLEMSRQRLRPSVTELNSETCTHCSGVGRVRSAAGQALQIIRAIEVEGMQNRTAILKVHTHTNIAFYLLNTMRADLQSLEQRYHFQIIFAEDHSLGAQDYRLETVETLTEEQRAEFTTPSHEAYWAERAKILADKEEQAKRQNKAGGRDVRRRGRERFGRDRDRERPNFDTTQDGSNEGIVEQSEEMTENGDSSRESKGRGRRGRRGGRGRRREGEAGDNRFHENNQGENVSIDEAAYPLAAEQPIVDLPVVLADDVAPLETGAVEKPRRGRGRTKAKPVADAEPIQEVVASPVVKEKTVTPPAIEIISAPKQRAPQAKPEKQPENVAVITDSPDKPKKGWWSKFMI